MFTSRAEHRLLFNHGSAEFRMLEHAKSHNLLSDNRISNITQKKSRIDHWVSFLEKNRAQGGTWADGIRRDRAGLAPR